MAASSSFVRSKSVVLRVAKGWMPKILSQFQSVFAQMCWPGFVEGKSRVEQTPLSRNLPFMAVARLRDAVPVGADISTVPNFASGEDDRQNMPIILLLMGNRAIRFLT